MTKKMCPKSINLELMAFDTNNLKSYYDLIPVSARILLQGFQSSRPWDAESYLVKFWKVQVSLEKISFSA